MNGFFKGFVLNVMAHLADKLSSYWNARLCWGVSQEVGLELKSYGEMKPFGLEVWGNGLQTELWQRILQAELLRSNSKLGSLIILSDIVYTGVEVCRIDSEISRLIKNNLGFSLCAAPSVCHVITTSDVGKKSEIRVSTDWCVTIEYWRSSLIRDYLHQLSD